MKTVLYLKRLLFHPRDVPQWDTNGGLLKVFSPSWPYFISTDRACLPLTIFSVLNVKWIKNNEAEKLQKIKCGMFVSINEAEVNKQTSWASETSVEKRERGTSIIGRITGFHMNRIIKTYSSSGWTFVLLLNFCVSVQELICSGITSFSVCQNHGKHQEGRVRESGESKCPDITALTDVTGKFPRSLRVQTAPNPLKSTGDIRRTLQGPLCCSPDILSPPAAQWCWCHSVDPPLWSRLNHLIDSWLDCVVVLLFCKPGKHCK